MERCFTLAVIAAAVSAVAISASGTTAMAFSITSPAFDANGAIPKRHSCDGANRSPALRWSEAPTRTQRFALIVDDPDAPGGTWVHWVLYDLPAGAMSLPEGIGDDETLADGAKQGLNGFRKVGYGGPCPPPGKPHRYVFTLYALDAPTGAEARASKANVLRAIEGHVLGRAELVGTYAR